jgi:hypothetical protein
MAKRAKKNQNLQEILELKQQAIHLLELNLDFE